MCMIHAVDSRKLIPLCFIQIKGEELDFKEGLMSFLASNNLKDVISIGLI